jgi:hypothetical protein
MTKLQKRRAKWLALLKVRYNTVIPLFDDVNDITEDLAMYTAVAELAAKGYLKYGYEYVEDDEGIRHPSERGYRFTDKGMKLLEEANK